MSVLLMGKIWEHFPSSGGELNCALALADHATDEGTSIFPSVTKLAKKTRQSERTCQRQLRTFEEWDWLQLVTNEQGGRHKTREYRVNPAYVASPATFVFKKKGDNLSPFPVAERVTSEARKGDTAASEKGDIAVSPESSVTVLEPSIPPPPPGDLFGSAERDLQAWFDNSLWPAYPLHKGKAEAWRSIRRLRPDAAMRRAILDGITRWLAERRALTQQRGAFVPALPLPASWLNGRRWEDEPDAGVPRETTSDDRCASCGAPGVISHGRRMYCRAHYPLSFKPTEGARP